MKTTYIVSRSIGGADWEDLRGVSGSMEEAFAAAGRPDAADWFLWDDPRWRLKREVSTAVEMDAIIRPERIPETDADRIELAAEMLLDNGQYDGDHHKKWVIDQALRLLLGERYEQTIADWRDGEDGEDTYEWDTGIAP